MWLAGGVNRDGRGAMDGIEVVLIVRDMSKDEDDEAGMGVKGLADGLRQRCGA